MTSLTKVFTATSLVLAFWLWWVMRDYDKLNRQYMSLNHQMAAQQALFNGYLKFSAQLNKITKNHLNQRNEVDLSSEQTKEVIKKRLSDTICATHRVPSDAIVQLHKHSERIRSTAANGDPSLFTR